MTKKYDVGYKKPPRQHQFRKGQSGNPKGRPKKEKVSIPDSLETLMNEVVTISENGKTHDISILEAIIKRLLASALSGNAQSLKQLLLMIEKYSPQTMKTRKVERAKKYSFTASTTMEEAEAAYRKALKFAGCDPDFQHY